MHGNTAEIYVCDQEWVCHVRVRSVSEEECRHCTAYHDTICPMRTIEGGCTLYDIMLKVPNKTCTLKTSEEVKHIVMKISVNATMLFKTACIHYDNLIKGSLLMFGHILCAQVLFNIEFKSIKLHMCSYRSFHLVKIK